MSYVVEFTEDAEDDMTLETLGSGLAYCPHSLVKAETHWGWRKPQA